MNFYPDVTKEDLINLTKLAVHQNNKELLKLKTESSEKFMILN